MRGCVCVRVCVFVCDGRYLQKNLITGTSSPIVDNLVASFQVRECSSLTSAGLDLELFHLEEALKPTTVSLGRGGGGVEPMGHSS